MAERDTGKVAYGGIIDAYLFVPSGDYSLSPGGAMSNTRLLRSIPFRPASMHNEKTG